MGLKYDSLDQEVRQAMVEEISSATASGSLYPSKRLTDEGRKAWPGLLRSAAIDHDDNWLATTLQEEGLIVSHEYTKAGVRKEVNIGAACATLAEGQFNFFYCIGVCVIAMASGENEVEIYRARASQNPRPSSEALVGTRRSPVELLTDLRQSGSIDTAIGLNRPNSGLSVRRVQ
jgi:hypothetical protein